MRIAVWHNLPSGGAKRALYYHVKGLVARGHTLHVWRTPFADSSYLPLDSLVPETVAPAAPFSLTRKQDKNLYEYFFDEWHYIRKKIRVMDEHCRASATEINAGEFDLVYAGGCMLLGTAPLARYLEIPRALYLNEPFRYLYEATPEAVWRALPPPDGVWWSPSYTRWFVANHIETYALRLQARDEYVNARAYNRILTNSFYSRESILRAYGLDAQVCYLGVDAEMFRPTDDARGGYVIGLGSFTFPKGVDRAIRAVASIPFSLRPRLVWVGNAAVPYYYESFQKLAASLHVEFDPYTRVTDAELVNWLAHANALIYTPHLEPFGLAPLEANACETPVVAIAEGGVRESVIDGENGYLLPDASPEALGAALVKLFEQPERAKQMGKHGRARVLKNWTWELAVERLEENLRRVISA